MPGLLIVNADDLGFSRRVSEATLQAFQAGGISSATALVWMGDSDRAVAQARESGLRLGLHLNFTVEFAAVSVPLGARNRQRALVERFGEGGRDSRRLGRRRSVRIRDAVRDQLERLAETYGEPTHVDGHHHVHLVPDVLAEIPLRFPVRPPLDTVEAIAGGSSARPRVEGRRSAQWAVALEHLHPDLGGAGGAVLARAAGDALEVMAHPGHEGQLSALVGAHWRGMIAGLPLGSYADLPGGEG